MNTLCTLEDRVDTIVKLCDRGYASQIVLLARHELWRRSSFTERGDGWAVQLHRRTRDARAARGGGERGRRQRQGRGQPSNDLRACGITRRSAGRAAVTNSNAVTVRRSLLEVPLQVATSVCSML